MFYHGSATLFILQVVCRHAIWKVSTACEKFDFVYFWRRFQKVPILKHSPLRLNMFLSFWYISQNERKTALWHDLFLSYSGLKWYSLSGFPNFLAHICKWNVQSYNFAWLFHIIKVRRVISASFSLNELDSCVVMIKSNITSILSEQRGLCFLIFGLRDFVSPFKKVRLNALEVHLLWYFKSWIYILLMK